MPANILIADPASEWMRAAVPVVVEQDLAASAHTIAFLATSESVVFQGNASEILRITVETYRGQLEITGTLTDAATQQTRRTWKLQRSAANPVVLIANALAAQIDPRAGSFAITSDRALKLFTQAVQLQDARTRAQFLRQAIEADPRFGLAYVALLSTLASADPKAIAPVLSQAAAQANYFTALDRARVNALRLRFSHAPLEAQAQAAAEVLKYNSNDVEQLTQLASDRYLQGNGAEGDRLMRRALSISSGNVSVRQQYARGLIETRRFREAEHMLQPLQNEPAVVADLAFCALLQGDRIRADGIAEKFFATVPSPDLRTALHAAWFAMSGDIPRAVATIESATFQQKSIGSVAFSQAALWQVSRGDFAGAQKLAENAQQMAPSPAAMIARLLSNRPASASAWRSEVEKVSQDESNQESKDLLTAYGYFLFGFYPDAVSTWQALVDRSGNTDLPARAMLAASLNRAGHPADARKVLVEPFLPDLGNFYAAISFAEMRAFEGRSGR